jgi:outer membrane protein assembly factor BamB
MEKVKRINEKVALAIIAVLLISSSLVLLNSANTVSAQTQSELLADDMYGWPVGPGYDGGNTFFNPGPGPNRPDVLWETAIPGGIGGFFGGGPCVAFDQKVFIFSSSEIYALDPFDGDVIWTSEATYGTPRGFGTGTMFKVADGYIGYEASSAIVIHETSDGDIVGYYEPTSEEDGFNSHGGGSVMYWGGFYSDYDMRKYTTAQANPEYYPGIDTPVHLAVAYDLSDPENPTLDWTWKAPTGIEALGSAPGLGLFGGYGEGEIYALNATTGELVWKQWKKGNAGYAANYWDGKIYHSASSTAITCYNATNGDIIFDQQEGGRAFFVFGDAIAYERYLGKNIATPNGYVGAWDAYTGEPLWRTSALYYIAYLTGVVADGKFYIQRYSGAAGGAEEIESAFACFDVFTGDVIWEMPGVSFSLPMIAYGNLYGISGGSVICIGDGDTPQPMFHIGNDIDNPGIRTGQSGPNDISEPVWTYDSGAAITGSAVAGNGKVYFGTLGEEVHCVNAYTGEMEWTFPLGYRMSSTPALIGDRLYIGPDDGNIYCLDAETGDEIWTRPAGGKTEVFWISAWQPRSSPIVVGGKLYVGSLDGNLYCVDASGGGVDWTAEAGGASRPPGGTPLVVPEIGMVFISSSNAFLYAFDMDDGTELWRSQLNPTGGFDDRALISTPVWDEDDGTLWIVSDTMLLDHLNATTGEFINKALLPYSAGSGTMTPAITTPAIQRVGNNKYLYVGDGFQLVCFDITTITLDPMLFTTYEVEGGGFFSSGVENIAYYKGPPVTTVNATTANNVNLNVSLPNYSGNETHLPLRWERWLGHQVYSSPVVADERGNLNDKIYFGDDVFSITAINASDGTPRSVYTTEGQVFSTACLYEGWLYMPSQDGALYAFKDQTTRDFTITATSNKPDTMWNNETLVIKGRLLPAMCLDEETGFGSYDTNGYPNATINLSVTKPDNTDDALETTTDDDGWFEFSYSPTEVGDYGWVVYYDGEEKPWITYNQAYGEWTPITVTSPTAGGGTEPPSDGGGIPVEYVYVAVAVIVIVLVVVGVYVFIKRGK